MKAKILKLLFGALAITLVACSSPKKLLKNENFDAAITKAIKQARGAGDRAKIKHLSVMGKAFYEANQRDLIVINSLKRERRNSNWEEINSRYNRLINRQTKVAPYVEEALSLGIDVRGYLEDYTTAEASSRKNAAKYLYENASHEMVAARQGDKLAARKAYRLYQRIDRYFDIYEDKDALQREAVELGRDHIYVEVVNKSNAIIPAQLGYRMLDFGFENLNDIFHQYYVERHPDIAFDYEIDVNILDMVVTPESERVETYEETKEVPDGFEYVLDTNGNVLKDTAGNDIKVDKFKTIRATVEKITQFKAVALSGNVEYYDLNGNRVIRSEPIGAEAVFENLAGRYFGDRAALSDVSLRRIGNRPLDFPRTEDMLEDAVELIKPNILRSIERIKTG